MLILIILISKGRGATQALLLKLYRIPVSGSCVPEMHMTCAYDYFLAVSEYDEQPSQSVFHLGTVGEIVHIEWMKEAAPNQAFVGLEIANYPRLALERNPELEREAQKYVLEVGVKELKLVGSP